MVINAKGALISSRIFSRFIELETIDSTERENT
jgi:hypothetical protein